jgi:hypothetical protein
MVAGPHGEMAARAAGRGLLRASHADRNQVIDVLKAAYVQGRLTKDELDARLGQTLAARTYAELAALTADIPPGTKLAPRPRLDRARAPESAHWAAHRAVQSGVAVIGGIAVAAGITAAALGQPGKGVILAVFIVILAAIASALVGSVVGAALKIESLRRRKRSRRRFPTLPASGAGGQASPRPSSASPFEPVDPGEQFAAEATQIRRPRPRSGRHDRVMKSFRMA